MLLHLRYVLVDRGSERDVLGGVENELGIVQPSLVVCASVLGGCIGGSCELMNLVLESEIAIAIIPSKHLQMNDTIYYRNVAKGRKYISNSM